MSSPRGVIAIAYPITHGVDFVGVLVAIGLYKYHWNYRKSNRMTRSGPFTLLTALFSALIAFALIISIICLALAASNSNSDASTLTSLYSLYVAYDFFCDFSAIFALIVIARFAQDWSEVEERKRKIENIITRGTAVLLFLITATTFAFDAVETVELDFPRRKAGAPLRASDLAQGYRLLFNIIFDGVSIIFLSWVAVTAVKSYGLVLGHVVHRAVVAIIIFLLFVVFTLQLANNATYISLRNCQSMECEDVEDYHLAGPITADILYTIVLNLFIVASATGFGLSGHMDVDETTTNADHRHGERQKQPEPEYYALEG